ncbi:MAG: type II toxin-antitoxin system RelE/ParE family toxin [candidate division NC10 bacterium]|nr:type II toxin-antitoxin system RelE/ParE family toxin [candidate division NC10 bacterium]
MAQVSWTSQALDDVEALCLFIARDAPRYAEVFADRVFRVTDRLARFPRSGRVVPEIGREDIREIIVQSYRVI